MIINEPITHLIHPIIGNNIKIALKRIHITHNWYNVSKALKNNIVTLEHGTRTTKFTIPDGFYLWYEYMNTLIDLMDKKPVPKLDIRTNKYTGKVNIKSSPNVQLKIPMLDNSNRPNMVPFAYLILVCEIGRAHV